MAAATERRCFHELSCTKSCCISVAQEIHPRLPPISYFYPLPRTSTQFWSNIPSRQEKSYMIVLKVVIKKQSATVAFREAMQMQSRVKKIQAQKCCLTGM